MIRECEALILQVREILSNKKKPLLACSIYFDEINTDLSCLEQSPTLGEHYFFRLPFVLNSMFRNSIGLRHVEAPKKTKNREENAGKHEKSIRIKQTYFWFYSNTLISFNHKNHQTYIKTQKLQKPK